MMPQPTTVTPAAIFSDVLANLAFILTSEEPASPVAATGWWEATITYRGPACGTLRLQCTREFASQLAANLLGVDPTEKLAAAKAEDSLKELLNVTCGQLVTTLHGTRPVFDLSIPQVRLLPADEAAAGNFATIYVEGHTVRLAHEPAA